MLLMLVLDRIGSEGVVSDRIGSVGVSRLNRDLDWPCLF